MSVHACYMLELIIINSDQDGVVLGADTRATEGTVVADKNCSKIHYISQNLQYVNT